MEKNSKTLAEYYALGAINLQQLLDGIPEDENLREVLEYALLYEEDYNIWCKSRKEREDQMKEDWGALEYKYCLNEDEIYAMLDEEEDDRYKSDLERYCFDLELAKYSDADLEAAYQADWYSRKRQIRRIAKEAHNKHVSYNAIGKFIEEYKLSNAEITIFWVEYYKSNFK